MIEVKEKIKSLVGKALTRLNLTAEVEIEQPKMLAHGDFSTNVAMILAREQKTSPLSLASQIVSKIAPDPIFKEVRAVAPGFINFYFSEKFLTQCLTEILKEKENFGRGQEGQKVIVEYTDPNPFKEFHIGHLMSNTIGEAISRLFEFAGNEVKRACYQGDVGAHVAMAIWGLWQIGLPSDQASLFEKVSQLGRAYALGATCYEKNKKEIDELNKKIYEKSDEKINEIYEKGKKWSLEYFDYLYKILGSNFDYYFFESEGGVVGKKIVLDHLDKVFEKSENAIIFRGEKYGLHTRVFVNSYGLPTYEAKELGLAKIKAEKFPYDLSIIVTGNEIDEYFKVLLQAMSLVFPALAQKTRHLSHGMLRLPAGKMASRKGEVITALALLNEVKEEVKKKMEASRFDSEEEKDETAEIIAVGALKFTILKRSPGRDIIFNLTEALSLEGDSGPYLQYTTVRARAVLAKAQAAGIEAVPGEFQETILPRLLCRFPTVVKEAQVKIAPQLIVDYLLELAGAFNNFYNRIQIIDDTPAAASKVALTQAVAAVLSRGLWLLGIRIPAKM